MKTTATIPAFSQLDLRYMHRIFRNPSYTEKARLYQVSWYFDFRANGKSPQEAYEAVLDTLDRMHRPEEERL